MPSAYPLSKVNIRDTETLRKCRAYVQCMQRRLDKAVADGDKRKIRYIVYLLTRRSNAVRILATHRVTVQNEGKKTPGVDGMRIMDEKTQEGVEKNNKVRQELLKVKVRKKPSPIRRIYIKKPNGKQRPLGISTVADRVVQDIIRQAIEPITEYHASDLSYGFRPKRGCHDAIEHIFKKMSRRTQPQWVIEGDISSCFDNIRRQQITKTLHEWKIPKNVIEIIERMLKANIFENNIHIDPETGAPQGGILSPMLANVALTTLDEFCEKRYGKPNPIVRYADDFVVVCKSKEEAIERRKEIAQALRIIGLELSYEKTAITNIHDGFNFLGFNIRKYKAKSPHNKYHEVGKLLTKPQNEKVVNHLHRVKAELKSMKASAQNVVIHKLNPIIRGFAMYYRHAVSKEIFSLIDHNIWYKTWRWAERRHPNKPKKWIKNKYFKRTGTRQWNFTDGECRLFKASSIPITRYVKVKSGIRVHGYSEETREYWERRDFVKALSKVYSDKIAKLYRKQEGKCGLCGELITEVDIIGGKTHSHHIIPRTKGGNDKLSNLRLLHDGCHRTLHSTFTRDFMTRQGKRGRNYLQVAARLHAIRKNHRQRK